MITPDQLLAFGVAAFVLIVIPGPSVVFVIGRALAYGRGVALATVLGNSLGLLAVARARRVRARRGGRRSRSTVFTVLKLAGRGVPRPPRRAGGPAPPRVHVTGTTHRSACRCRRALRQGFVVGVSNPKAFMIFAAVLPQFVDRGDGPRAGADAAARAARVRDRAAARTASWALLASRLRTWFDALAAARRGDGRVGGVSMIGLGVGLAVTGEPR